MNHLPETSTHVDLRHALLRHATTSRRQADPDFETGPSPISKNIGMPMIIATRAIAQGRRVGEADRSEKEF